MNEADVVTAITRQHVHHLEHEGQHYFFFDPGAGFEVDKRLPFATIVTSDAIDEASNLDRMGVYRLNVGVSRATYEQLFGPPPPATRDMPVLNTGYDYKALDQLMPHPIYAPLGWVCVLNPSATTFQTVRPLLHEAWSMAERRFQARNERP
ncbi:DUF6194 family protein [Deinococcus yavapaiensis]|uniref:DUF6194 domain-containing protein n=1 Tax=Deinococcus yavapaiensis KR-236 TaxID=694435 RepID=A0A318S304_9DEIO|nr:DUF6194 family protein [Deinococcus yavapaiensis]PYE50467.1 hypothetical protein DES52_11884 [Deinococcus yavapaiensis KR-236]